jgi:hypothetical protein
MRAISSFRTAAHLGAVSRRQQIDQPERSTDDHPEYDDSRSEDEDKDEDDRGPTIRRPQTSGSGEDSPNEAAAR